MISPAQEQWLRDHTEPEKRRQRDLISSMFGGGLTDTSPQSLAGLLHQSEGQVNVIHDPAYLNLGAAILPASVTPVVTVESNSHPEHGGSDLAFTRECTYNPKRGMK